MLLMGVALLFVACQAPPEAPTTTTPIEPPTTPVETPQEEVQGVTVNGDAIPAERIQEVQQQLGQFTGQQISAEQATQYLIEELLLLQEAQRRNLVPSQTEVETAIQNQLAMQEVSLEEFQETLQPREYENIIAEQTNQLSIQALQQDVTPQPTEEQIAEVYEENQELFADISEEEAREQIIQFLSQAQSQEALAELLEELFANADIQ